MNTMIPQAMKELIYWREDYNLGIQEIDAQHQKMVGIINHLYSIMNATLQEERKNLPTVILELKDYADYHFATEEKYFEQFNYEKSEEHTATHNAYRAQVAEFFRKYNEKDDPTLASQILDFLQNWWIDHITGIDREYIDCFKKHGLS